MGVPLRTFRKDGCFEISFKDGSTGLRNTLFSPLLLSFACFYAWLFPLLNIFWFLVLYFSVLTFLSMLIFHFFLPLYFLCLEFLNFSSASLSYTSTIHITAIWFGKQLTIFHQLFLKLKCMFFNVPFYIMKWIFFKHFAFGYIFKKMPLHLFWHNKHNFFWIRFGFWILKFANYSLHLNLLEYIRRDFSIELLDKKFSKHSDLHNTQNKL